jgi:hypothetical protein
LKKVVPQQFAKNDKTNAISDKDNSSISSVHYHELFDRITPDPTVLDELSSLYIEDETNDAIYQPPYDEEVTKAIMKMKSVITPGATGVTSDMLKALPDDARSYIAHIIKRYWKGEINPEESHVTTLTMLYKGKRKTKGP